MLQIHVNICKTVQLLQDFFSAMAESWKTLKASNVLSSFIVCWNRIRSALVREFLSLVHTHDLIFFTTDLRTVNDYATIHCKS